MRRAAQANRVTVQGEHHWQDDLLFSAQSVDDDGSCHGQRHGHHRRPPTKRHRRGHQEADNPHHDGFLGGRVLHGHGDDQCHRHDHIDDVRTHSSVLHRK